MPVDECFHLRVFRLLHPFLFDPTMQLDQCVTINITVIMILGSSSSIVVVTPLDYCGVEVCSKGQVFTGKRVVHPQPDWWYVGGRMMPGESPARRYQDTHTHSISVCPYRCLFPPLMVYIAWTFRLMPFKCELLHHMYCSSRRIHVHSFAS